jgi:hypothetical protein
MDELTKLLKSLSTRMERLEVEGNKTYKDHPNVDNIGNFKRSNNNAQIIEIKKDGDDQKFQTPLQNNLLANEGGEEEDLDP